MIAEALAQVLHQRKLAAAAIAGAFRAQPVPAIEALEEYRFAGALAARAALSGEAVLLEGLDRWYRLGPEGAGYCPTRELGLVGDLREGLGDALGALGARR